jgi:8-oxo-dGTP pyrophosphatase MutT (NUDIX family)
MEFPVSVKGVLLQHRSVVLLKNERAEWELPGGRLELGETPEQCLAREFTEELGCAVEVGPLLDCWVFEVLPGRFILIIAYGVELERQDDLELRLSDEHQAIGRFPVSEIGELALPDGYRRAVHRWAALHNS